MDPLHSQALPLSHFLSNIIQSLWFQAMLFSSNKNVKQSNIRKEWLCWVKMHKAEFPCSVGRAIIVAWNCLQLHQSWQNRMNHCHSQNPCVHLLHQHIVWGREQFLEHPPSNGLASEGIYQNTPSAHFASLYGNKSLGHQNWPFFQCSLLSTSRFLRIHNIQQECITTKLTNLWLLMSRLERLYLRNVFPSPKSY